MIKRLLLLSLVHLVVILIAHAKPGEIDRVEPLFWWTGMNNPELQVMVKGEDISQLTPSIDYPGVTIKQVIHAESPNYLFIDLHISSAAAPGNMDISFKSGKKVVTTYSYELKQRREGSAQRVGYNTSDVIYLITPDRFVNGDPSNDANEEMGDPPNRAEPFGRHGGDIQGIMDHLDDIKAMGFTALWINPLLENNMPQYSYHGYAMTDFYRVDPRYGSNELYVEMVAEAKKKGIKNIMDMVMNHCGSGHWWMADPPSSDWLNFQDGWKATNHKKSAVQDPYAAEIDQQLLFEGWFSGSMPDMNQKNPLMATYLIQNTIWWIEYADLDGIRMDTHPYPDQHFMSDWSCAVMSEYPNFNMVGEEWNNNPYIVAYWQRGKENPNGYTSCMPGMFDFPLQAKVIEGLTDGEGWGKGVTKWYEALGADFMYSEPWNLVTFPDNHDMDRYFTQVKEDYDAWKLGMAYFTVTRGIPQFYYGTEILLTNSEPGNHGLIREDYPGGWEGDQVNAFTGEGLTDQQKEAKAHLSKLLNWRKSASAVHHGKLKHYSPSLQAPMNQVYVMFRYTDQDKVMVIFNNNSSSTPITLDHYGDMLEGVSSGKDVVSGQSFDFSGSTLEAPAKTALILELN